MKIVFFGTSEFAVPALEALHGAGFDVTVVTMPDQPVGRKKIITSPSVKVAAEKLDLKVLQPESLKNFELPECDLGVVVAYGKIIPQSILDSPKHGFINIHPSLLPKYRGPTPMQTALLNGDTETGVTVMQVDAEVDHGPILIQKKYDIWPKTTYPQLSEELARLGTKMLLETIRTLDSIKPQEQNHAEATFTKIFNREDAKIDWSRPAQEIFNQIRALNPEPGTWTTWNGKVLNIKKAVVEDDRLVPTVVQLEGKNETSCQDFLSGHPDFKLSDCR